MLGQICQKWSVAQFVATRLTRRCGGWWFIACAGFCATMVTMLLAWEALETRMAGQPSTGKVVASRVVASKVLAGDDWNDRIRSDDFWRPSRARDERPKERAQLPREGSRAASTKPAESDAGGFPRSGRYRTVCVRLCDGFFFPINYATASKDLDRDAAQCERSCASPARLYIQHTKDETVADLVDLKGMPYSKLKTANLFRTTYDAACKCRPEPWEQAAIDRHRMFALEAEVNKGNATVVSDLAGLRAKVRQAAVDLRVQSARASVAAAKSKTAQSGKGVRLAAGERVAGAGSNSSISVQGGDGVVISTWESAAAANGSAVGPLPGLASGEDVSRQKVNRGPARQASIAGRDGIMRLGVAIDAGKSAIRRASVPDARSSGEWVRRAFNQN